MLRGADAGAGSCSPIGPEVVISKMKDDGDFDRLRVKVIRKFKENENLRSSIASLVKQSGVLNRPGAEAMKPRQLSDAIHQEIGEKVMSQISDGLWNIIRSPEGMKTEITETVQSVYDKLLNPNGKYIGESSLQDTSYIQNEVQNLRASTGCKEINGSSLGGVSVEPSVLGLTGLEQCSENSLLKQLDNIGMQVENKAENLNFGSPLSTSAVSELWKTKDVCDEDPDVPPGFG